MQNILDLCNNPKREADNLRESAFNERRMGRNDQADQFEETACILDHL